MRFLAFVLLWPFILNARDFSAMDAKALEEAIKAAQPGDTITLREGTWTDTVVKFKGQGTEASPITLRTAVPGKTIFTGASALRMGGEYLVVEGLWFQNPDPVVGDTLEFRIDSKNLARHCRLTGCAVTLAEGVGSKTDKESRWEGHYGSDNQMDHCLVQGKTSKGTTVVVWLGGDNQGRHLIEHNYFGPREKLGKNGGETIRVGDSSTSMQTAACVIRENIFEKCNGEAECISNKSCGNLYQGNSFMEVSGTLTLRHGNGCTVENNGFFGNGAKGTGGIRIIGEDHVVRGNYLENLTGDDVRSSITLMNGLPNSPANGYFQVKRARVENNTLVNCEHPILIGIEGGKVERKADLPPLETVFIGNKISAPKALVIEAHCDLAGVTWQTNQFSGKELGIPEREGITWGQTPEIEKIQPLPRASVGPGWWK